MDTCDSLRRVIEQMLQEQPGIDLILATGDLSQDGSQASYERFRHLTDSLGAPVRWLAGNHDELPPMQGACAGTPLLEPIYDLGAWRVIMLDSSIPGAVPGFLADSQLELLERALSEAPQRHHLICLHHHPVPIGCKWMEPIGLRNPAALFAILDRFPQARALLWGISIRSSTRCVAICACSPRLRPACSSRRAVKSSRSAAKPLATAGCACMPMARWIPVFRA